MYERGIAQHADFSVRTPLVTKPNRVVYYLWEMRIASRFAIARESEHVGMLIVIVHLNQLLFQCLYHDLTCWVM